MITTFLKNLARRRARARAVAMLERLDDRRLRDIGISRDQIELYVDGGIRAGVTAASTR